MATQEELRKGFLLGEWRIRPNAGQIERDGVSLHIEPKLVEVLLYLAHRPGEVISREELLDYAWHKQVVCDEALTRTISELRTLLGDSGRERRYIRTVPKRGYSLIAEPRLIAEENVFAATPKDKDVEETAIVEPTPLRFRRLLRWWIYGVGSLTTAGAAVLLVMVFFAQDVRIDVTGDRSWPSLSMPSKDFQQNFRDLLTQSHLRQFRRYAVLPFTNLTPDQELGSFSQGLEEDIRTALFSLDGVQVAGRLSSNRYVEQMSDEGGRPVHEIATALNVDAIVDGTVRLIDGQIRVTVQLLDGKTGFPLWSKRYDQAYNQQLKLQTLISDDILCELDSRMQQPLLASAGSPPAEKQPSMAEDDYGYGHTRHVEWLAR